MHIWKFLFVWLFIFFFSKKKKKKKKIGGVILLNQRVKSVVVFICNLCWHDSRNFFNTMSNIFILRCAYPETLDYFVEQPTQNNSPDCLFKKNLSCLCLIQSCWLPGYTIQCIQKLVQYHRCKIQKHTEVKFSWWLKPIEFSVTPSDNFSLL